MRKNMKKVAVLGKVVTVKIVSMLIKNTGKKRKKEILNFQKTKVKIMKEVIKKKN